MGLKGRLLLVEPESMVALGMKVFLSELGYEICGIARNALEALRLAEALRPNLALVDHQLDPACDGLTVARELDRRFSIPSVLISDRIDEALIQEGCILAFLSKPFAPEHLTRVVEAGLDWLRNETLLEWRAPGLLIPWRRRH